MIYDLMVEMAPILMFDSREEYFPSTIDYYLANSDAISADGHMDTIVTTGLGMIDIPSLPSTCTIQLRNSDCRFGFNNPVDMAKIPYYTHKVEDATNCAWKISYFVFFPSQGPDYLCGCIPWWTSTTSNLHSIELTVDKDTNKLRRICLDGEEEILKHVELFEGRPMIYCSLYTHHLSLVPQNSFCNYHDEKGYILCPKFFETVDPLTLATFLKLAE